MSVKLSKSLGYQIGKLKDLRKTFEIIYADVSQKSAFQTCCSIPLKDTSAKYKLKVSCCVHI